MLMVMYSRDQLDETNGWIDNIQEGNKVISALYEDIEEMKNWDKTQILEVDRYYSMANMKFFFDDSREKLSSS